MVSAKIVTNYKSHQIQGFLKARDLCQVFIDTPNVDVVFQSGVIFTINDFAQYLMLPLFCV